MREKKVISTCVLLNDISQIYLIEFIYDKAAPWRTIQTRKDNECHRKKKDHSAYMLDVSILPIGFSQLDRPAANIFSINLLIKQNKVRYICDQTMLQRWRNNKEG